MQFRNNLRRRILFHKKQADIKPFAESGFAEPCFTSTESCFAETYFAKSRFAVIWLIMLQLLDFKILFPYIIFFLTWTILSLISDFCFFLNVYNLWLSRRSDHENKNNRNKKFPLFGTCSLEQSTPSMAWLFSDFKRLLKTCLYWIDWLPSCTAGANVMFFINWRIQYKCLYNNNNNKKVCLELWTNCLSLYWFSHLNYEYFNFILC